jgi:hypothetical protein
MKSGQSTGTLFEPQIRSGLKLGLTLIVTFMVVSSPIIILVNPVSAAAPSYSTDVSPSAPSTIGQDGSDFTTQAALSSLTARPTNNIVNTNSFYDVVFLTASSGVIKTIDVTFPAGTTIPSGAFFNEAEGIGPGTASKSGQTITYTVTNAVNVPAGTKIRLEFANINNPLSPSASLKVTVTTRDAANAPIDGPTESAAYTMKQIGTNAIADGQITTSKIADGAVTTPKLSDNSITSTKPAESFMKKVILLDDPAGNALGWDPDGATTMFAILASSLSSFNDGYVSVLIPAQCRVTAIGEGVFNMICSPAPAINAQLHYLVINLPAQVNE